MRCKRHIHHQVRTLCAALAAALSTGALAQHYEYSKLLAPDGGAVIKVVDIDVEDCTLDMDDLRRQITPRTKLVAVGYASNAVGTMIVTWSPTLIRKYVTLASRLRYSLPLAST